MISQIFLSAIDYGHTKVSSNDYGLLALARGDMYYLNEASIPPIKSSEAMHFFISDYSYPFVKMLLHSYETVIISQ